jgi:hypothetical protein
MTTLRWCSGVKVLFGGGLRTRLALLHKHSRSVEEPRTTSNTADRSPVEEALVLIEREEKRGLAERHWKEVDSVEGGGTSFRARRGLQQMIQMLGNASSFDPKITRFPLTPLSHTITRISPFSLFQSLLSFRPYLLFHNYRLLLIALATRSKLLRLNSFGYKPPTGWIPTTWSWARP